MPWISRREIARLERELKATLQRAKDAEDRLQAERASKDWLITQLTSRFVTKQGQYGLDHEPPPKPVLHPKGYVSEPSEIELAKLEYYKRCYREAGKSEKEAVALWEAEMRGETPTYEYEREQ